MVIYLLIKEMIKIIINIPYIFMEFNQYFFINNSNIEKFKKVKTN